MCVVCEPRQRVARTRLVRAAFLWPARPPWVWVPMGRSAIISIPYIVFIVQLYASSLNEAVWCCGPGRACELCTVLPCPLCSSRTYLVRATAAFESATR